MKRLMFVTLGTGRQVPGTVVYAIEEFNPDRVILLGTRASRNEKGPALVEALTASTGTDRSSIPTVATSDLGLDGGFPGDWSGFQLCIAAGTYAGLTVEFASEPGLEQYGDAEELQLAYRRIIRESLRRYEARREHAIADFSTGAKPMSAALYAAAVELDIPVLNYVTGERDEDGEVIPGTERARQVRVRRLRVRWELREAREMFDSREYQAAYARAEATESVPDALLPHDGQGRRLLVTAGRALAAWNRFRFDEALSQFQNLGETDLFDPEFVGEHFITKRRRHEIQRHLAQARGQQEAEQPTYFPLVADLVGNAGRASDEGAHDDAIARLYRALEFLAQLRIWEEFELLTGEFPVERLPDGEAEETDETAGIGLVGAWKFLAAEGDDVGTAWHARYEGEDDDLKTALQQRNESLLAHGFRPVDAKYVGRLRSAVERLARVGWGDDRWEEARRVTQFPSLEQLDF